MTDSMPPPAVPPAPAPPTPPTPPLAVPPSSPTEAPSGDARIYDLGYRRYEGERTGVTGSMRSLVGHSVRHALGLGRSARFKVLPVLIVGFAYLPAIAIIGVVALFPIDPSDFLPTYAEYYGFVTAAIYLFVALIGPLLLCSDRRNGLLGVYLAAALNRPLYLVGKAISITILLLLVTLGPPLLLLISLSLQNLGPDGFGAWLETLGQIMASSLILGVLFAAVATAISSTTDRTIIASVSVLATILGSTIVTATMVDGIGLHPAFRLGDLLVLPQALIFRIADERSGWPVSENPTWTMWLAWFGWVTVCVAWTWFRYRRLLVRR
ncbi:MAG: hypothetical protein AAFN30_01940 [Actinomycetota bacterium]